MPLWVIVRSNKKEKKRNGLSKSSRQVTLQSDESGICQAARGSFTSSFYTHAKLCFSLCPSGGKTSVHSSAVMPFPLCHLLLLFFFIFTYISPPAEPPREAGDVFSFRTRQSNSVADRCGKSCSGPKNIFCPASVLFMKPLQPEDKCIRIRSSQVNPPRPEEESVLLFLLRVGGSTQKTSMGGFNWA